MALPPRDCPLCPRLAAFRATQRAAHPGLVQRAGPALWRRRGRAADRRSGAGTARRQPHRPPVHRRLCRRSALRDLAQIRRSPRGTMTRAPMTGWRSPARASPTRCAACRRRTSPSRARSPTAGNFCRTRSRRCRGLRAFLALGAIAHDAVLAALGLRRAAVSVRAWRRPRAAGRPAARRQLSLLAPQHQHRQADRGDVRSGVRGTPRPARPRRPPEGCTWRMARWRNRRNIAIAFATLRRRYCDPFAFARCWVLLDASCCPSRRAAGPRLRRRRRSRMFPAFRSR